MQDFIHLKGSFFQKPLQFSLEVSGETWKQGDSIQGVLTVKDHGSSSTPKVVVLQLARGNLKKVKEKAPGAMTILESKSWQSEKSDDSFSWEFKTEASFPITDSSESPYLLYGSGEDPEALGRLQVLMEPAEETQAFLKVFETEFRFVRKDWKQAKTGIEVKLNPPSSTSFAALEKLILLFVRKENTLRVDYEFRVKKLSGDATSLTMSKDVRKFSQELELSRFRTPFGRIDSDRITEWIREIVSQVESKVIY